MQVTFVAVYGGGLGAAEERITLARIGKLLDNRRWIEDIAATAIADVACCVTCGTRDVCFRGITGGVTLAEMAVARVTFCTPIKRIRFSYAAADPDMLEAYICNKAASLPALELEDNGFVLGDPKAPATMTTPPAAQTIAVPNAACS